MKLFEEFIGPTFLREGEIANHGELVRQESREVGNSCLVTDAADEAVDYLEIRGEVPADFGLVDLLFAELYRDSVHQTFLVTN